MIDKIETISKIKVEKIIDNKEVIKLDNRDKYNYSFRNLTDIIDSRRLDVFFKIAFLNYLNKNYDLAIQIYYNHLKAITFRTFKENKKNNFLDFVSNFINLNNNINCNDFKKNNYIIPVCKNGIISDGSHRMSILINKNCKIKIKCLETNLKTQIYDFNFFKKHNIENTLLEIAIIEQIKKSFDIKIAIIWPSSKLDTKKIKYYFKNIIYIKELALNKDGEFNFVQEIYKNEKWLGNSKNNYLGTHEKTSDCFKYNQNVKIVILNEKNNEKFINIKREIRNYCKVNKNSIHTFDDKDDILEFSKFLLNPNCQDFLNRKKNIFSINATSHLESIVKELNEKKIDKTKIIFTSGFVLKLFGIRDTMDFDYLALNKNIDIENFNSHNQYIKNYNLDIKDMLYNPKNYLSYRGLKFLSINNILEFKKNRNEPKDQIDIEHIKSLNYNTTNSVTLNYILLFKYFCFSLYHKFRRFTVELTKILGIYNLLKKYLK